MIFSEKHQEVFYNCQEPLPPSQHRDCLQGSKGEPYVLTNSEMQRESSAGKQRGYHVTPETQPH